MKNKEKKHYFRVACDDCPFGECVSRCIFFDDEYEEGRSGVFFCNCECEDKPALDGPYPCGRCDHVHKASRTQALWFNIKECWQKEVRFFRTHLNLYATVINLLVMIFGILCFVFWSDIGWILGFYGSAASENDVEHYVEIPSLEKATDGKAIVFEVGNSYYRGYQGVMRTNFQISKRELGRMRETFRNGDVNSFTIAVRSPRLEQVFAYKIDNTLFARMQEDAAQTNGDKVQFSINMLLYRDNMLKMMTAIGLYAIVDFIDGLSIVGAVYKLIGGYIVFVLFMGSLVHIYNGIVGTVRQLARFVLCERKSD